MAGNFFKDGDVILLAMGKNSRSGVKLAALPLAPNGELAEEQSRYLPNQTYLPKFVQEKKVRNISFIFTFATVSIDLPVVHLSINVASYLCSPPSLHQHPFDK